MVSISTIPYAYHVLSTFADAFWTKKKPKKKTDCKVRQAKECVASLGTFFLDSLVIFVSLYPTNTFTVQLLDWETIPFEFFRNENDEYQR